MVVIVAASGEALRLVAYGKRDISDRVSKMPDNFSHICENIAIGGAGWGRREEFLFALAAKTGTVIACRCE
jgi:hypothetical protein